MFFLSAAPLTLFVATDSSLVQINSSSFTSGRSGARDTNWSVSPSTGFTDGGDSLVITGSGFSDLAFSNTTYDGIDHQWVETTVDYGYQTGPENAIAVDSNGHVHIVYVNDNSNDYKHAVYDGSSWSPSKIKDCEGSYCKFTHMVIDDNDDLHVAHYADGNYLYYMYYDGSTWTSSQVATNVNYGDVGIAVDSNYRPHISYSSTASHCGSALKLAYLDGTTWTKTVLDNSDESIGCDSAIVMDDDDHVYIAYQVRSKGQLKFITNKSGSWDPYVIDDTSGVSAGWYSSMVMGDDGQFHIAHYDYQDTDLRYATGTPNGQWTTTIIDSSGNTGRQPFIAMDSFGNAHIAYNSWTGWDLKYAVFNSTTSGWDKSTISTTGDVGQSNSLFIDQSGIMHVAFSDETNNNLKYATKSIGMSQTNEISVQFGQYGQVTGTVVNDTTIRVTTPLAGQTAENVDLTLWDKDGNGHILSSAFTFISPDDLDSDGVLNSNDDCPNVAGNSTQDMTGCPDADGDGYSNTGDAFPNDATEWMDSDDDGVGNNSDLFPNDANETMDSDGDGVGDNADLYPLNANEWEDLDGNQIPDNSEASKVEVTTSSDDGKIHPYHIYGNNLTLSMNAITSEGFTMVSMQSTPDILPNTGGQPYGFYGGDSNTITLDSELILNSLSEEFFTGEYISEISQWVNFTIHVTGAPHGCEELEEWWDLEQQVACPSKVANYRTDYYLNFSMMFWNGDDDNDGVANSWDLFPSDANESQDSDGDGVGDNRDAFAFDTTQWSDTDGDGYGDNWGNASWNATRKPSWPGLFVEEAYSADYCPEVAGNSTADGFYGCLDNDGNGIADFFEVGEANETGGTNSTVETNQTEIPVDTDEDGVFDIDDNCLGTPPNIQVDAFGCEVIEAQDEDKTTSAFESFFSGDNDPVTTTVGIGAILLALFTLLQTNAVAAVLPDAFRWVQVLRKNSKLSKEEENELSYLQSVVQAYFTDHQSLIEELRDMKADLTARYTNNQIKKETREKLFTIIDDLMVTNPDELEHIAHNDVYFGLAETLDTKQRVELLKEKVLMDQSFEERGMVTDIIPNNDVKGTVSTDGYEYLELPTGSGNWFIRNQSSGSWERWSQ